MLCKCTNSYCSMIELDLNKVNPIVLAWCILTIRPLYRCPPPPPPPRPSPKSPISLYVTPILPARYLACADNMLFVLVPNVSQLNFFLMHAQKQLIIIF